MTHSAQHGLKAASLIAALLLPASLITLSGGGVTRASFRPEDARLRQDTLPHDERVLKKSSWPNEVVKIIKLKVKKGPVEFDKRFTADDDWLRGLTLTVKNVSDKPVAFMDASVTLFKNGEGDEANRVPVEFSFSYGSEPASDTPLSSAQLKAVAPGDSVDVALSEESYARLREMLRRDNYPLTFKGAEVTIDRVLFSDGVMWYKSFYFLRDPNNPSRWIRDKHFRKGGTFAPKLKSSAGENRNRAVSESREPRSGCGVSPPGWGSRPFFSRFNFGADISISSISSSLYGYITPPAQLQQDCGSTAGTASSRWRSSTGRRTATTEI